MTAGAASAHDRVGIDLRASVSNVAVGDVVSVDVNAVREPGDGSNWTGAGEAFVVMDLYFAWDPNDLRLIGVDAAGNAPQFISAGLPSNDSGGVNEAVPPADGTGYFLGMALAFNAVPATYEGNVVTRLRFMVLREFESTTVSPLEFVVAPNSSVKRTRIFDATWNGLVTTGSLTGATFTQGATNSCPANLVTGPDSPAVDGADLGFMLAAWGTVDSPANLVRGEDSPAVDGADLAVLLAAWGSCGS